MNRHFKKIEEFEDYYISFNGNVYSKKSNKYIKHDTHVTFHKNGKKFVRSIKKILEITFPETSNSFQFEKFKPIINFENYKIDKSGNIYSKKTNDIKKGFINSSGYKCIFLSKNGKSYNRLLHRLVYEAWKGEITDGLTVDHIDEDKTNNHIDNLQLLSRSDNVLKFHSERNKQRDIDGFIKIENFDNYYVNKEGVVISFKYGEKYHEISHKNGDLHLRKNNKRHYINLNFLLNKYFGVEFEIQGNRKYVNC